MRKPTPRRVVRKHRRDLREPEREHEIEEELERSDGLPALSVLLAHERKLAVAIAARTDWAMRSQLHWMSA